MGKDPTIVWTWFLKLQERRLGTLWGKLDNKKNLGTSWTHAHTVSGCFLRCFPSGWTAVWTAGTRWRDSTRRISGPWTMSFRTRTCFLAAEDFQLSRCNFIIFHPLPLDCRNDIDLIDSIFIHLSPLPWHGLLWSLCPHRSSRNVVSEAGERLGATGRQHWTSGRGTAAWRGKDI